MKKLLLVLLICYSIICKSQITFFGEAANPSDNGTLTASPATIIVPGSMTTGDLVTVWCYCRNTTATITVSTAGGQTWNDAGSIASTNATLKAQLFWCTFNGTWGTNPAFAFSVITGNVSAVMHVYRPTNTGKIWAVDGSSPTLWTDQAAAGTFTAIWGAVVPVNASSVSITGDFTDDDNTWGTLTGSGWSKTSMSAQWRNLGGNDASSTYAYNIQTTASSIANTGQNETANGSDGGVISKIIFYEFTPAALNHNGLPLVGVGEPVSLMFEKISKPQDKPGKKVFQQHIIFDIDNRIYCSNS